MKLKVDHDYHLHSYLSRCSKDPEQTNERLLQYAKDNGMRQICLTNHFWDDSFTANRFYKEQNYEHIRKALPLPTDSEVSFYFGAEGEMDKSYRIGITDRQVEELDFIIIPTTHLHMKGFTIDEEDCSVDTRRVKYIERFEALLKSGLPFHKVGIAHLTATLIDRDIPNGHFEVLSGISDQTFRDLFTETAKVGMGVELNVPLLVKGTYECEVVLRPYIIAKECGCKFYFGSDAHHPSSLMTAPDRFTNISELLELTEADRFDPFKK